MRLVAFAILIAAVAVCGTIAVVFRWDCNPVVLTSGGGSGLWNGNLGTGVREPGGREYAGRWDGSLNLDVGSTEMVVCVDRWTGGVAYWLRGRGWSIPAPLAATPPVAAATPNPRDGFRPLATPTATSSGIVTMDGKKYRIYPDGRQEPVP